MIDRCSQKVHRAISYLENKLQMKTKRILRTLAIAVILISNIGCDQISKNIARQNIDYHEQISLMNDYLLLTRVENTGAFLSVGHSLPQPFKSLLLTILPLTVLALALMDLFTKRGLSNLMIIGICFVIGGGFGNLYDRIVYGSVTDFLHLDFGLFRTGIFNMADVSIMIGMFLILMDSYYLSSKTIDKVADENHTE